MLGQYLKRGDSVRRQSNGKRSSGLGRGSVRCVETDDIAGLLAQAEAQGGRVHTKPFDLPGVGKFALLTDAQGRLTAVTASEEPPAQHG